VFLSESRDRRDVLYGMRWQAEAGIAAEPLWGGSME
jgi:hypothetical protein